MNYNNAYEFIDKGFSDNFKLNEWRDPEELKYVDYRVIMNLDDLRDAHGNPIYPSRAEGGLIRTTGSVTSRHHVDPSIGKLGQAIDVFPEGDVRLCWLRAVENTNWGGIGVYLDTNRNELQPGPMMHLDIDPRNGFRAFWIRVGGDYVFLHEKPNQFWFYLAKA